MEPRGGVRERWLVVGAAGMLGQDMVDVARGAGHDVVAAGRGTGLDILDPVATTRAVQGYDVVVNCAAWTAVDDAEAHEPEAFAVNAVGAAHLARACASQGARLVHVSTDYVFDGSATAPYAEDAPVVPRSAYGRTKAAGEWAVRAEAPGSLIVRTAWLYGAGGPCFPRTIARLAAERDRLDVVDDQVGQPTWTRDLAGLIVRLVAADVPAGIYHGTSAGEVSWYGFAERVVAATGNQVKLEPTTSDVFPRPAPRPAYSVLSHAAVAAAGVTPIGDWSQRWSEAAAETLGPVSP
ncbi:dTDP-4-dehydrorhamnose reductase [Myceligenerans indicum]|uniref:dTDP-4-dehydrorhamnose reductase n=1 Tax=Myceligenerans indicum TaxID=2593663 RepID=A0ABS1LHH2_9MICO|nr:dTDP-4-dehydrorhamnose reductase [Myceligenerans indicum]MBL0885017.1 dTDP-4-dehydrorhamnose reductase [Myceligenerans indicum]